MKQKGSVVNLMIRILFIIPYSEMKQDLIQILQDFSGVEKIEYRFALYAYNELADQFQYDWPCDIIIARGYAADILSRKNLPCVIQKMNFNSVDIINAVYECKSRFHSKKIAVVGHPSLVLATETVKKICDIPIGIYKDYGNGNDFDAIFEQVLADGCDTVIAGRAPCARAQELGIPNYLAKTNLETLYKAITDSIHVLQSNRRNHNQLEILRRVIDNSTEGYLLFNSQGNLSLMNKYAEGLFSKDAGSLVGQSYRQLMPELAPMIERAYKTGEPIENELLKRNRRNYTLHIMPILSDPSSSGLLIDCRDIDSVQEMEIQIRKRLASKGMVTRYSFKDIIHKSASIDRLIEIGRQYAGVDSNIVIEGQTGTGKELFAQSIHAASKRSGQPFVAINCASIPESLLESELFGYAPGAFTGASKEGKQGFFELAHNGTLFLDEIGELPLSFQGKLLRALQEHEIRRLGDDRIIPVNVRIIAATNRNLMDMVRDNSFRRDLYFRLNILQLSIPPLSARKEDILIIFQNFLNSYAAKFKKTPPELTPASEKQLTEHEWFGNIRELRNAAERFMVLYSPGTDINELLQSSLNPTKVFFQTQPDSAAAASVPETVVPDEHSRLGKEQISAALEKYRTREDAAKALGISRATLWRRMRQYHL